MKMSLQEDPDLVEFLCGRSTSFKTNSINHVIDHQIDSVFIKKPKLQQQRAGKLGSFQMESKRSVGSSSWEATELESRCGFSHIHPLLIPHVADAVMSHLSSTKDLFACRQVCRQWKDSSTTFLRRKQMAYIGRYCTNISKLRHLVQLPEIYPNSKISVPVANFVFCQDTLENDNIDTFKKFFSYFAPILESLIFWLDLKSSMTFDKSSFLFSDEKFKNLRFPKLRSLEFDDQRGITDELEFENSGPMFLNWLIQAAPNLSELKIKFCRQCFVPGEEEPGVVNMMLHKLISDNSRALKRLKTLRLDVHLDDALIYALHKELQDPATRLQRLHFSVRGSRFSKASFYKLLECLKQTLQTLKFTFLSDKSRVEILFPRMETLHALEISGWNKEGGIHFHSLCHHAVLPVLRKLHLTCWCNKPDWWQLLKSSGPVTSVRDLKLPEEVCQAEQFESIVRTFPNLEELSFCLSVEELRILEILFENYQNLQRLSIHKVSNYWSSSSRNLDQAFSGIPSHLEKSLLKLKNLPQLASDKRIRQNVLDLVERPSLLHLKKLRRLEMSELQYVGEITDVTGYLVFMQMDNLQYLDAGRSRMSDECMKRLAERFPENMAEQERYPALSRKDEDETSPFLDLQSRPKCIFL